MSSDGPGNGRLPRTLPELLAPRPHFDVRLSRRLVAQALWDHAEDELCARALRMNERELADINRIAAWYEHPDYPLPLVGQRTTHNHVAAFAAITLYEGRIRPLEQTRRRPTKDRPELLPSETHGP